MRVSEANGHLFENSKPQWAENEGSLHCHRVSLAR